MFELNGRADGVEPRRMGVHECGGEPVERLLAVVVVVDAQRVGEERVQHQLAGFRLDVSAVLVEYARDAVHEHARRRRRADPTTTHDTCLVRRVHQLNQSPTYVNKSSITKKKLKKIEWFNKHARNGWSNKLYRSALISTPVY